MPHPANQFVLSTKLVAHLELITESHAKPLLTLLNENRNHLRRWLPWVDAMQTEADFLDYIRQCKRQHTEGTDYGYVILVENEMAGRIGIHQIDTKNKSAMLGYWLGEAFTGNGIITAACQVLSTYCFNTLALNRIEIKCATGNYKSQAIPKRLHFQQEGILREAELVNGEFLDLLLYSMLKKDWQPVD